MKKRLVLALTGAVAIVMGVALFAAFESHMINIEAHIEKATYVSPEKIDLDTVFPQENLIVGCIIADAGPDGILGTQDDVIVPIGPADCPMIWLSHSFKAQTRVNDVHYEVYWVDKPCVPSVPDLDPTTPEKTCDPTPLPDGTFVEYDICRYMQIFDSDPGDNNDVVVAPSPFNCQPPPTPGNPSLVAQGTLITGLDEYDIWDLVYWVPVCEENYNPETDPGPNPPPGIPPTTPAGECWDPDNVGGSYHETDQSNELKFQVVGYSFAP
jgi:hypothetical protein